MNLRHRYGYIDENLANPAGTISKVTAARLITHFFVLAWLIAGKIVFEHM